MFTEFENQYTTYILEMNNFVHELQIMEVNFLTIGVAGYLQARWGWGTRMIYMVLGRAG